jgi:hypothetical protein
MQKEEKQEKNEKKLEPIEQIEHLKDGAFEFEKFIFTMKNKLVKPELTIIFISGMVGYSCQATLIEKKQNYTFIKTNNGKKYILGDALNYYLFKSKYSFYNILMGYLLNFSPDMEPFEIEPFLKQVVENIGNEKYLIGNLFNPEKIFDFEFYQSTWKEFYNTLNKYCKSADEWPILFSISMTKFLDLFLNFFGIEYFIIYLLMGFENAIYVSKISQID